MFYHIAEFIRVGAVPAKFVPTGLDDQDITFMNIDHIHDHLGCVNAGIADQVGNIGDDAGADPFIQRNLTDGPAVWIEVFLAIHVGGEVDAGVADGTIAAHTKVLSANPFGVGDSQGNIVQPLGSLNR